ncbi:putative transcriptional regulator [Actinoalloteichus hoggarensis]|uniref:MarR family protein n=1 Tax=Actinoalloteichus hoggarensis TaxID=1470176 RepID=A0A221W7Y3_9PSEU|nr:MarR family transcriptional regulator [Actinoalloteichus hoggarensis]ASO21639.1 MarR family protein [Actinoalloteichus hoggarensis]MBB5922232.1 putative transcriptional regulator [Actinoalloteichus hoggarensis]
MTNPMDAAERLALTFTQGGMQRTTARVMSALLFADQETTTAGELADRLQISPGTVSTALKNLFTVGLIERVPAPGSRREHFRFRDDAWTTLMSSKNTTLKVMQDAAQEGIDAAGEDSIAGRRLIEMRDFYSYLMTELPAVIDRWTSGEIERGGRGRHTPRQA